jgi:O-antigen/teichoic acid export membrane protein
LKKIAKNSDFIKDILTLVTGNAIAFIVSILLYPVLSRIFSQQDYALFGLYFAVFTFLEIASAGRYDFAVVMPERDEDAINIVAGALIISSFYCLIVLVLVFLLKDILSAKLNNPLLADWLFLLPIGLFLVSISKLLNGWLIRIKKFRASSVNKASQKIAEGATQMVFGALKQGNGLILGDIAGRVFNAFFSYYQSVRSGLDRRLITKPLIAANLIRYVEFPKYGILPSMLNTLGGMLPVFFISSYYSMEVSGSFNFSRIILSVPFALISVGISQVLMQQVSERRHKNETIYREVILVAKKLIILSIAGIAVLALAGPELFEFIFGSKWRQSGEFTTILIFSYAVSFVVSPFSMLLVVLGKMKWISAWQIFYFFAISILFFLSNLSIQSFLVAMVIIDIISYAAYGFLILKCVRNYEDQLTSRVL